MSERRDPLGELTDDQCRAIRKSICPGCLYGLPESRDCDRMIYTHSIPGMDFTMDCRASGFRDARATAEKSSGGHAYIDDGSGDWRNWWSIP